MTNYPSHLQVLLPFTFSIDISKIMSFDEVLDLKSDLERILSRNNSSELQEMLGKTNDILQKLDTNSRNASFS